MNKMYYGNGEKKANYTVIRLINTSGAGLKLHLGDPAFIQNP